MSSVSKETINGLYLLFGLVLGFTAEFWVGMANIQIKYSHKLDAVSTRPRAVYRRWRWWLGLGLLILNISFNFASFMFASLNILAPTSALVIVINAVLARWYFAEKLTNFGIFGSMFIMIGCVLSIIFGTHSQDELKIDDLFITARTWKFVLFTSIHGILCIVFGIIGSMFLRQKTLNVNVVNDCNDNRNESQIMDLIINTDAVLMDDVDNELKIEQITKEEYKHILRCVLLAFSTAGLVAWVQFLGKIGADLLFESIFNGNNQFTVFRSWAILLILIILLLGELYLMTEIMRIFDAVLIIPIYNSLQILSSISLSAVYFNNFHDFSIIDSSMFTLGLIFIFSGIGAVSHGQKHESMQHHTDDQKNYIISAKKSPNKSIKQIQGLSSLSSIELIQDITYSNTNHDDL